MEQSEQTGRQGSFDKSRRAAFPCRHQADRKGQHSIRVNDQWRICFRWREGHAYDVEIVDYH